MKEFEKEIIAWHRSSELSCKLEKIPGIGPLAASALVASIADARSFDSGRQVSAWLGLVPRQSSSGGKPTLLGMSKRGDAYLRTLLIHGARSAILTAKNKVARMGFRDAEGEADRLANGSRARFDDRGSLDHSVRSSGLVASLFVGLRHVSYPLADGRGGPLGVETGDTP